jgi:hypothetical protein
VRIMARRRPARPQSVTAITTPPADAHIGTLEFAAVGIDEHKTPPHLTRRLGLR